MLPGYNDEPTPEQLEEYRQRLRKMDDAALIREDNAVEHVRKFFARAFLISRAPLPRVLWHGEHSEYTTSRTLQRCMFLIPVQVVSHWLQLVPVPRKLPNQSSPRTSKYENAVLSFPKCRS